MSNKNKKTNLLVLSVVAVVAMVILSVVGFVLAMTGVFAVNEFLLGFMILTAGTRRQRRLRNGYGIYSFLHRTYSFIRRDQT